MGEAHFLRITRFQVPPLVQLAASPKTIPYTTSDNKGAGSFQEYHTDDIILTSRRNSELMRGNLTVIPHLPVRTNAIPFYFGVSLVSLNQNFGHSVSLLDFPAPQWSRYWAARASTGSQSMCDGTSFHRAQILFVKFIRLWK